MGTLAAFWLFERAGLDAVVLEVGLGGRLDAVNIVDADLAVITNIGRIMPTGWAIAARASRTEGRHPPRGQACALW